jgi:hypothetical protein
MIEVTFEHEKTTPGTVRFKEVPDEDHADRGAIGTLYILKKDVEKIGNPNRITVKIEAAS